MRYLHAPHTVAPRRLAPSFTISFVVKARLPHGTFAAAAETAFSPNLRTDRAVPRVRARSRGSQGERRASAWAPARPGPDVPRARLAASRLYRCHFARLLFLPTGRASWMGGLAGCARPVACSRCAMHTRVSREGKPFSCCFPLLKGFLFTGHMGPGRSGDLFEIQHCHDPRVRCCCWVSEFVDPKFVRPC